jgi:hypothetical protein
MNAQACRDARRTCLREKRTNTRWGANSHAYFCAFEIFGVLSQLEVPCKELVGEKKPILRFRGNGRGEARLTLATSPPFSPRKGRMDRVRSVTRKALPARTMQVGAPLFFEACAIRVANVGVTVLRIIYQSRHSDERCEEG